MLRQKANILTALLVIPLLFSCSSQKEKSSKLKISVIPKGTTHIFWKSIHAGAIKAAQEENVDMLWVGPELESDRQQQITLVNNQVINQVDGIVLAPTDARSLKRPVREAARNNIPVVIIDSNLEKAEDLYTSFVATDNRKGGQIAGEKLGNLLGGKGKVIMLRLQEGSASTTNREEGFLEAIGKFSDIEVVSDEQYGGSTKASAQQVAETLIMRFKDDNGKFDVDGIFCCNESTTYGMLQALRRHRLAGKVKFVGFDAEKTLIEAMDQQEIHGLVVQNPFKMGYLGVKTIVSHLNNKTVEKRIDTGVTFVTREKMDVPEIKELLTPDINKWLKQ